MIRSLVGVRMSTDGPLGFEWRSMDFCSDGIVWSALGVLAVCRDVVRIAIRSMIGWDSIEKSDEMNQCSWSVLVDCLRGLIGSVC